MTAGPTKTEEERDAERDRAYLAGDLKSARRHVYTVPVVGIFLSLVVMVGATFLEGLIPEGKLAVLAVYILFSLSAVSMLYFIYSAVFWARRIEALKNAIRRIDRAIADIHWKQGL